MYRVGRCNLGGEGSELTKLLVAKLAPSGLATLPTDPIVFGILVASDAGTKTGLDMSGQGGLRPLPTEVVRNRDPRRLPNSRLLEAPTLIMRLRGAAR